MLPNYEAGNTYTISSLGMEKVLENKKNSKYPGQHVIWTDDKRVELPIRVGKEGVAALPPTTIIDAWQENLQKYSKSPALSHKENNKWVTRTYEEYYEQNFKFAKALIAHNIQEFSGVCIIGFNAPQWFFTFYGSIFARCIPAGVYSTNSVQACEYIANHCEAKIIVAQNREYAQKFIKLIENGQLQRIVLYRDEVGENSYNGKIVTWDAFIASGKTVPDSKVEQRIARIRPGQLSFLCYTSGTTGMPKGVMLSHDNCIWTAIASLAREGAPSVEGARSITYLPLSHAAAIYFDGFISLLRGGHVFFAQPTALQGTIVQTMLEVKPHVFFTVPRLWEKIYVKIKQEEANASGLKKKILTWARNVGQEGSMKQLRGEPTSWQFKLAKKLVFNKIKQVMGLEQTVMLAYGSAPLDPAVRKYLTQFNFVLMNGYGMTQTSAPHSTTPPLKYDPSTPQGYLEVGQVIPGSQTKIFKLSQGEEEGQICMRGRNVCMGYLKQPDETSKTIDKEGYLHSGDMGKLDKDGFLYITGRIKELVITKGGENIPPILIENQIKKVLPCLSNVMLVGDNRHYLTCLISILEEPPLSGNIQKTAADFLASRGCNIKTTKQAIDNPAFRKVIMEALQESNKKAISRAQMVQNFYLMPEDFTVENDCLTPNLKLKRRVALKKYEKEIEQMYSGGTPKL